jgi:predicted GIY-YIG superfamily endonuclease
MGHIYKITNNLNNKVYVGQTIKTLERRFNQHKNNYNKPYFSQLALY